MKQRKWWVRIICVSVSFLHWTVLYITVIYYAVLYCTVLYFTALHFNCTVELYCTVHECCVVLSVCMSVLTPQCGTLDWELWLADWEREKSARQGRTVLVSLHCSYHSNCVLSLVYIIYILLTTPDQLSIHLWGIY